MNDNDRRQLMIVRQSSIKAAVEWLSFKGDTEAKATDVVLLAKAFTAYVMSNPNPQ